MEYGKTDVTAVYKPPDKNLTCTSLDMIIKIMPQLLHQEILIQNIPLGSKKANSKGCF
jgi:hypothetical protein